MTRRELISARWPRPPASPSEEEMAKACILAATRMEEGRTEVRAARAITPS
jgi:hypothetical protein